MKNTIGISFLLLALVALMGCQEAPPQRTDLYIYLDFTEGQDYTDQLAQDADKYIQLMNISEGNDRNYGSIRVYPIHDVATAASVQVKLKEGKSALEGNKYLRKKELDEFKQQLLEKTDDLNARYTGQPLKHSHIFHPLCKGVKKLNRSDASRKLIVIYSDMLENSEVANLNGKKLNSDRLEQQFDNACGMEDLSDCEVYIVHPVDKKNDQKIRRAANFWEQYLIGKGLDVDYFHFEPSIDI
ncbi:MAG: hypothetical protein AAFV95_11270 [Bacteroidota bacterium]